MTLKRRSDAFTAESPDVLSAWAHPLHRSPLSETQQGFSQCRPASLVEAYEQQSQHAKRMKAFGAAPVFHSPEPIAQTDKCIGSPSAALPWASVGCMEGVLPSPLLSQQQQEAEQYQQHLKQQLDEQLRMAAGLGEQGLAQEGKLSVKALSELETQAWACLEELNMLAQQQQHSMPGCSYASPSALALAAAIPSDLVRGYHSLTRGPKASVANRFTAAVQQQQQHAGQQHFENRSGHNCSGGEIGVQQQPLHVRAVLRVLDGLLGRYREASITKYILDVPPYLQAWVGKWGLAGEGRLTVFAVQGFDLAAAPSHSVLVPCFGDASEHNLNR